MACNGLKRKREKVGKIKVKNSNHLHHGSTEKIIKRRVLNIKA